MRWTKVLLQSSVLNMNYSSGAHNIIASHLHVQRTMLMLIVCSIIFIGTRKYWAATVVDIAGKLCHWDQFPNMTNLFLCLIDWMKQMEISTMNVSQVWWWWIQYFLVMWKLFGFFFSFFYDDWKWFWYRSRLFRSTQTYVRIFHCLSRYG